MTDIEAARLANKELIRIFKLRGKVTSQNDPRVITLHRLTFYVNSFKIQTFLWMNAITVRITELPRWKKLDLLNSAIIVSDQSFAHYYLKVLRRIR